MQIPGLTLPVRWLVLPVVALWWSVQPCQCTFSRLVTPCETPFGLGRCVADRKCCQDFGGIIFTADGLMTPKKELIQYRIAGINAPKNFIPDDRDEDTDGPGHIFPRANLIGCSDVEVCCFLQPVSSNDREISTCNVCGIKGDGDNKVNIEPPEEPPARQIPVTEPTTKRTTTTTTSTTTTTTTTTTTPVPLPPRKVIPRIFDYSYSFDYSKMARIMNGRNANKNSNCWQVALSNASGVFGSGVLLDFQTVLTVAHKVAGLKRTEFITILGAYDFASDELFTQTYYTYPVDIIIHPNYDPKTFENDIAILKIPPVSCDKPNVCTVCLPDGPVEADVCLTRLMPKSMGSYRPLKPGESLIFHRDDYLDPNEVREVELSSGAGPSSRTGPIGSVCDRRCVVTGWGSTKDQEIATVLQETKMAVINKKDCEARFKAAGVRGNYTINKSMFCARAESDDSGTCDRDGGGPLICQRDDGRWELVGLTALGLDQCRFGDQAPSVFVTVGRYLDWITKFGLVKQKSSMGSRNIPLQQPAKSLKSQLELRDNANLINIPPPQVDSSPLQQPQIQSFPKPQQPNIAFLTPLTALPIRKNIPSPGRRSNFSNVMELRNYPIEI